MDDGAGGSFAEVDAANINNKPTLRSYLISSFTASDTKKTYRFKLRVENLIGFKESVEISHVLAAAPDKPAAGPILNLAGTSTSQIRVDYAALTVA